jgi:hypothetical protein
MLFAALLTLPEVGHGFAIQSNWLPQFIAAYQRILQTPSYSGYIALEDSILKTQHIDPYSGDLPIFLIPSPIQDTLPVAFLISGDGGWGSFDQAVAENLAERGIPVVGLDAIKYFRTLKTP